MDLSDLINQLGSVTISTPVNIDNIVTKIIMFMHESSEIGKNDYTYYFDYSCNINPIIDNLLGHFPDIYIKHTSGTNYIFIDWS